MNSAWPLNQTSFSARRPVGSVSGQIPAPGREIQQVERKRLVDGRVVEFVWMQKTETKNGLLYETLELVESPPLMCRCSPVSSDDVTSCEQCKELVCVRRHSATCQNCGKVFCSGCLEGVIVRDIFAIVCKPCAAKISSSTLKKVFNGLFDGLGNLFWGD